MEFFVKFLRCLTVFEFSQCEMMSTELSVELELCSVEVRYYVTHALQKQKALDSVV